MEHIFENVCQELEYNLDKSAFNKKLIGPQFIGQGCSRSVGSDCYGYYIVEKKQIGKKTIWGITCAKDHIETCWEDGTMVCDGPVSWKADEWIIAWGKMPSGKPKWWYCDSEGNRFAGQRCGLHFAGAHSYRDPSF